MNFTMKQLALGISPPPQPTLDNFVPGANAELLGRLRELRAGAYAENVLYLWGEQGSGKSHLIQACAGLTAIDDVEKLGETAQIDLFNAINAARESGGAVVAAGNAPPAQLPLREDLKSRLAWGLVYQLKPLTDEERAAYLRTEAARRGLQLPEEAVAWLMTRMRRDLRSLAAVLDRIDQVSLELKRPITLPLVREALKEETRTE
jgi:DnaA family protein